jgi:hypothetical protein
MVQSTNVSTNGNHVDTSRRKIHTDSTIERGRSRAATTGSVTSVRSSSSLIGTSSGSVQASNHQHTVSTSRSNPALSSYQPTTRESAANTGRVVTGTIFHAGGGSSVVSATGSGGSDRTSVDAPSTGRIVNGWGANIVGSVRGVLGGIIEVGTLSRKPILGMNGQPFPLINGFRRGSTQSTPVNKVDDLDAVDDERSGYSQGQETTESTNNDILDESLKSKIFEGKLRLRASTLDDKRMTYPPRTSSLRGGRPRAQSDDGCRSDSEESGLTRLSIRTDLPMHRPVQRRNHPTRASLASPLRPKSMIVTGNHRPSHLNRASTSSLDELARELGPDRETIAAITRAIEARTERKILDLEIANKSFQSINASLEEKVRKQSSMIEELERRVQRNSIENLFASAENALPTPTDGSVNGLTEDELAQDQSFQRICAMIEHMKREAQTALELKTEIAGGRVLQGEALDEEEEEEVEKEEGTEGSVMEADSEQDTPRSSTVPSDSDGAPIRQATGTIRGQKIRVREILDALLRASNAQTIGGSGLEEVLDEQHDVLPASNISQLVNELELILFGGEEVSTPASAPSAVARRTSKHDTAKGVSASLPPVRKTNSTSSASSSGPPSPRVLAKLPHAPPPAPTRTTRTAQSVVGVGSSNTGTRTPTRTRYARSDVAAPSTSNTRTPRASSSRASSVVSSGSIRAKATNILPNTNGTTRQRRPASPRARLVRGNSETLLTGHNNRYTSTVGQTK